MFFHPTLSEVTFDTVIDITSQMSEHSWGSIREYLRFCAHAFFLDKDYSYGVPHKIAKAPLPPYYSKEERLRLEEEERKREEEERKKEDNGIKKFGSRFKTFVKKLISEDEEEQE